MRIPSWRPVLSLGVVALLVVVLIVLAVLQYRWSGQISEAERERLRSSLNISLNQFREEFQRELIRVAGPLFGTPGTLDWKQIAERYDIAMQSTPHPDLVSQVYRWDVEGPLRRLNRTQHDWDEAQPSAMVQAWRERINKLQGAGLARPQFGWAFEPSIPALVRPVYHVTEIRDWREQGGPPLLGWLLVVLNEEYLQREFLPELAQRYFTGPDGWAYQVAVVDSANRQTLYHSSNISFEEADAKINLAEGPSSPPPPGEAGGGGRPRWRNREGGRRPGGRGPGGLLLAGTGRGQWQLLAKHPAGSVEIAVNSLRWRNLAVSFGVLLLLALSMAIILLSAQRAQRLAAMQMEFVAGVSHELRTPLAVICSAADNLADGVVAAKSQVEQYGDLIRTEGRRLAEMVEQILRFAAGQAGRARYELRPLPVDEILDSAAASAQPLLQTAGGTLETHVAPDLPPVLADAAAIGQCLNNLLSNAIKYGGNPPWVGLRAVASPDRRTVAIAVEDHGLGIEPNELPHIFEPFYRGEAVTAAQIHGTGLGLSLAKSMAEAMSGRLAVESTPGRGSTFTLSLPATSAVAQTLTEPAPHLS